MRSTYTLILVPRHRFFDSGIDCRRHDSYSDDYSILIDYRFITNYDPLVSNVFQLKATMTLTFDPLISKSIGFMCWSWPRSLQSLRFLGPSILKLLIGNGVCHTNLDLWPIDLKIIRVHLLVMANQPTKFEVPGPKRSQVIDRKPFFSSKSHWHCPLTHWP